MKALLLALAALLGGVLALEWHGWSAEQALPAAPAAPGRTGPAGDTPSRELAADALEPPPKEDYASVVERPLFLPERRPPPPEEAEEPTAEEAPLTELTGVDLTAVVITPAVVSAWVRSPGDDELKRLRLGDDFEGWTVKAIAPDELVLERQGETNRLSLRDYANAPPAIPPTRLPARPQRGAATPGGQRGVPPARQPAGGQADADGSAPGQSAGPPTGQSPGLPGGTPAQRRQANERDTRPTTGRIPIRQPPQRPPTR